MKNLITYFLLGVAFFVGSFFVYQIDGLPSFGALLLQIIMLALYFIGIFCFTAEDDIEKLNKKIGKKLTEKGFEHWTEEGVCGFKKQGGNFHYYIWNTNNNKIKRVFILFDFSVKDMEKGARTGYAILADAVNCQHRHTTTYTDDNGFVCRYEFAIENANDFMFEMENGCNLIFDAVQMFINNAEKVQEYYPAKEQTARKVGFNINQTNDNEEQQIAAQANTEIK